MEEQNSTPEKVNKLPKWLTTITPFSKYLAMSLFIVLPFVGFYLGMQYQSKTSTNDEVSIAPVSFTQPSGKVAYRQGGTVLETGNVWTSNADGTDKKQITKSKNVDKIYNWSPDNKYLLAEFGISKGFFVVDVASGKEMNIPIIIDNQNYIDSNLVWVDDKNIAYAVGNIIYKAAVEGKNTEIASFPSNLNGSGYSINKSLDYVAYNNQVNVASTTNEIVNVYTYNLITKQKYQITQGEDYNFLGWFGNNIIYTNNTDVRSSSSNGENKKAFWISSPDGENKKQITKDGWDILSVAFSPDSSKLFITAKNKDTKISPSHVLFSYDSLGKMNQLFSIVNSIFSNVSRDGNFSIGSGYVSNIINNDSDQSINLCETSCYSPVWQN